MITFDKGANGRWVVATGVDEIVRKANAVISSISDSMETNFIADCNDNLFQDIASRIVATEFFKVFDIDEEFLTILISFSYQNKDYAVSLGKLPDPTDPKGNPKIVESRYIL